MGNTELLGPYPQITHDLVVQAEKSINTHNMTQDNNRLRSANCSSLPIFVNKLLLAHSHAHSFTFTLWLLLNTNGRVDDCTAEPAKLKILTELASYRKSLLIPG